MAPDREATPALTYPEPPAYLRSRFGLWRAFGPGAIIASVTIGSGETVFASRAGAIFGYSLLWFIVVCAVWKLIQVYTAARYMTLTGEHPMEAWARLPGPRGWFPGILGALSVLCFPFWIGALSLMVGGAINWILGLTGGTEAEQRFTAQLFATGVIALAVMLTLIQTYNVFEKVQTVIVGVLLLAIAAGVALAPIEWYEAIRNTFAVTLPGYEPWMHEKYPKIVSNETVLASMIIFLAAIGGGTYDYIGYLSCFREGSSAESVGELGLCPRPRDF